MKRLQLITVIGLVFYVIHMTGCTANHVSKPNDPYPLRAQSANRLFVEDDITQLRTSLLANLQWQESKGMITKAEAEKQIACVQKLDMGTLVFIYRAAAARIYTLDELEMLYQFQIDPTATAVKNKVSRFISNPDEVLERIKNLPYNKKDIEELERIATTGGQELGRVELFTKYRKYSMALFDLTEYECDFMANFWDNPTGRSIDAKQKLMDQDVGTALKQEIEKNCPGAFRWQ